MIGTNDRIQYAAPRPASWEELGLVFFVGLSVGMALMWLIAGLTPAFAGGPVAVTWDQASDCPAVTGWELLQAPITTAQPNPPVGSATLGASIANTGTPPCGLAMVKTVTVTGIGPTRFWLRGVAGTVKSADSNSVDASLPFAKPGLTSVVP